MPNWCSNYIEIKGSQKNIKKIADILKENPKGDKLYETLIGLKPNGNYTDDWYDLNNEWFGCKWDTEYDIEEMYIGKNSISLDVESPWSPPIEFCKTLAKKYKVKCVISYEECGCDFAGKTTIKSDGTCIEEDYHFLEGKYKLDKEGFWEEIESHLEDWKESSSEEEIREDLSFANEDDIQQALKMVNEYSNENN